MRARDDDALAYVAPDWDEANAQVLAHLPQERLLAVFEMFWNSAVPETFAPLKPALRPAPVIIPVINHPMSPRAKAALANISAVAAGRKYFREENEKLLNLADFPQPREPGKSPPLPKPIIDTDATRMQRSIDETRKITAQMEAALADARARLVTKEKELAALSS